MYLAGTFTCAAARGARASLPPDKYFWAPVRYFVAPSVYFWSTRVYFWHSNKYFWGATRIVRYSDKYFDRYFGATSKYFWAPRVYFEPRDRYFLCVCKKHVLCQVHGQVLWDFGSREGLQVLLGICKYFC